MQYNIWNEHGWSNANIIVATQSPPYPFYALTNSIPLPRPPSSNSFGLLLLNTVLAFHSLLPVHTHTHTSAPLNPPAYTANSFHLPTKSAETEKAGLKISFS